MKFTIQAVGMGRWVEKNDKHREEEWKGEQGKDGEEPSSLSSTQQV